MSDYFLITSLLKTEPFPRLAKCYLIFTANFAEIEAYFSHFQDKKLNLPEVISLAHDLSGRLGQDPKLLFVFNFRLKYISSYHIAP